MGKWVPLYRNSVCMLLFKPISVASSEGDLRKGLM